MSLAWAEAPRAGVLNMLEQCKILFFTLEDHNQRKNVNLLSVGAMASRFDTTRLLRKESPSGLG